MININLKTKNDFRKFAQKTRNALDIELLSEQLVQKFILTDQYIKAKNILAYYPFKSEIDIKKVFEDETKNWFLPRINGDFRTFKVCNYVIGDNLVKNKWGILEPDKNAPVISHKKLDMVIIPALAIDENKIRLGYGGGFYDRFLPLLDPSCIKLALIADELLFLKLPQERHDKPVDFVLTQTKFF